MHNARIVTAVSREEAKAGRGFTLIELLVVIAIIGLLSSVVLASLASAREKANDAKRVSELRSVQTALELYYSTNNAYPACTSFSSWGSTWSANAGTMCLYNALVPTYIGSLPADPKNAEGGSGNYLGDNHPTDQAYVYTSDGQAYTLGTNLGRGGTANTFGNYRLSN